MSGLELSGFANVKVPMRERKFGSWKAWKRQWCVISRTGNTVSLQIGNDKCNPTFSVLIPEDAVLCRTESRTKDYAFGIFQTSRKHKEAYVYLAGDSETDSQKWMSNVRCLLKPPLQSHVEDEFEISLIDNNHSRGAGLTGLYGNLLVTSTEILIRDTHTGKTKVTWHWSQISHSYLPLPANPEDVHRICTICTSGKFKTGEGELEIFCLQADKLHEKLSSCPRLMNVPKIVMQPLPPTPEPPPTPPRSRVNTSPSANSLAAPPPHPMLLSSRRMSRSENDLQKFFFGNSLNNLRDSTGSKEFFLLSSQENVAAVRKVPSLIFANIGFLISTPGCSEPGSMNDLRRISDSNMSNNDAQIPNINKSYTEKIEYEMIDEEECDLGENGALPHQTQNSSSSISSGEYEEILDGEFDEEYKTFVDTPPPLPPRKSNNTSPSSELSNAPKTCVLSQEFLSMMASQKPFDHKYLPMGNLKDKILVSGPIPI